MTLEKGKSYGQEQIQQTLQDKARTRLNNPAPHQAPQRERVSRATIPSARPGDQPRTRTRRWKSLIRPDVNMGVPQLMMILEPNIVWEHTKGFVPGVGRDVEANVTPGEFFEGWHKGGRRAHGVYEGSYWELMGDCDELAEMLRKLSKAPALLEEPPLELPPPPELPSWEDFKPNLHLIPAAPSLPPLKLPPFRAPILEPEPPFVEPEYLPVPPVPPVPKEEPLPIFIPPEFLQVEPLVEPEYVDPPPPVMPDAPPPPSYGQAKHGHDWTGLRPFQLDPPSRDAFLAEAAAQRVMDTSRFVHPPNNLPMVPMLEPLDADLLKGLDLEPIPKLELAWMGGPEPDPPYASVPSSPAALSRATSRPVSAARSHRTSAVASPFEAANVAAAAAATGPTTPRPRVSSAASGRKLTYDGAAARPLSAGPRDGDAAAAAPPPPPLRIPSARRNSGAAAAAAPSPRIPPPVVVKSPEDQAWEEVRSVASEASGTPRMWVNFTAPFAELPPIMMPTRPEPGPEPLPEDFPHEALEELPVLEAPAFLDLPVYVEPPQYVPQWAPPCEPRPVGFLRGAAPVLICDVSGTMNPRQQGRFRDMKRCTVDLLDPEGSRNGSPECSRFGGGFGAASAAGGGLALMPTQPDLLSDAQRWVANWPDAVGQTNLLSAFHVAEQHAAADCWYILSDGLAHDQQACLEYLCAQERGGVFAGYTCRGRMCGTATIAPNGCDGKQADVQYGYHRTQWLTITDLGSQQLSDLSPTTYRCVWFVGQGFVRADLRNESPEQREERQWAEKQLRAERIKNLRLGINEPLEVTMERVATLHQQLRVAPAVRANEAAVAEARRRHAVASESVRLTNERRMAEATASYQAAVEAIRQRNQAKVDAAREAFLQAHADWERDYLERLQDWEDAKATLERQRSEQLAATRGSPYSTPGKPPLPFVSMISGGGGIGSRPTSATAYAALPKNKEGSGLIRIAYEPSEQRAACAAAEYDAAMGLERLAEKLSSPLHTPPGSRPVSALSSGAVYGSGSRPVSGLKAAASGGGSGGGSRPVSSVKPPLPSGGAGGGGGSRPASGAAAGAGGGDGSMETGGGASEYLEAITEDLAEASAPLDALYGTGGAGAAAAGSRISSTDVLDDDGLDVRPSRGRSGGRDQDSAVGGSASAPPPLPLSLASSSAASAAPSPRPVSARGASAGNSARVTSARSSAGRKTTGLGMLPEGAPLPPEGPPPLPEPSAPLQPLRGEKSDEFKRRYLPPEVVAERDASNASRLDDIRQQWESLVAADLAANDGRKLAAMRRNAVKVEEYKKAVYEAYASGLVRDVVYGGAVRVAANLALLDNAEARYLAEVDRINAENARLRQLHAEEVEEKRAKEEAHGQAVRRWQEAREVALRQHEADRERARAEHEANINRLKAEWRAKTQQTLELNDARLTEAESMHEALVEQVKETNKRHKEEHTELLRQRKEVEATNLSRLAEAKAVHKVRLESRSADNERLIRNAMEEHQALCVRLQEEYEEGKQQAEVDHSELCTFLRAANEQLTEEARRRYQEALTEVQAAYEADCVSAREAHSRDLERVKRYNQEIWPKVHVARLAQAELARVQLFAEHIRYCANKFEMGVNFVPNTPNYDRVVEMQALTEALAKAFPDVPTNQLPWPEHEKRLEPGTGWVASPPARSLTYRDPMDIINRIARVGIQGGGVSAVRNNYPTNRQTQGKSPRSANSPTNAPSSRGDSPLATVRGHQAATTQGDIDSGAPSSSGSVDELLQAHSHSIHQPHPQSALPYTPRHLSRPLSAGRARFASVLNGDLQRPLSAAVAAPCSARVEAWGAAAAAVASGLSSPGGPLRPQSAANGGYQNPSAWRRSNTTLLRNNSPRYAASNLCNGSGAAAAAGGGGGSPSTAGPPSTLSSAAAAAAIATAAMGALTSRPNTARPSTAHSGASRPRSAGPAARPPARVAVDVTPLQASMARSKAQAGSHALSAATLAGFSKDVPKLRYPEVDVPQSLTIASSLRSS
ncbi:hypothetical protein VOLCADRAFT_97128 [Volvox carteri f. nagariensis]|uniref:Uncharacterized protein n=1 Tax=Volvox carteri f. nagariensis TaxID=3068 RepID=D8UBY5_VOLCA|nr:uncharacterized protein VOLCADRAFT_97128 [Volvox carteri f. nagariensis]EFJ42702.1 hypothetical protein VOLCADRAFT_97128 [Volvox carteri f. nagariensis]|eukprot:XP_002956163.1 hypothetical protein VOLCADRAFT_97128 [Volvox carteri f. nagariensis]